MLLRPEGATAQELSETTGFRRDTLQTCFNNLMDQKGWDIRSFPRPELRKKRGATPRIYKIVGKIRWDGGYRSLLKEPTR